MRRLSFTLLFICNVAVAAPDLTILQNITVQPHQLAQIKLSGLPEADMVRMDCDLANPTQDPIAVKYTYRIAQGDAVARFLETGSDFYTFKTDLNTGKNHLVGYIKHGKGVATLQNLDSHRSFTVVACTFSASNNP